MELCIFGQFGYMKIWITPDKQGGILQMIEAISCLAPQMICGTVHVCT